MPEICGRICPQDRLCEGNCVIEQSGHGTVTIGSIEKYITDTAWDNGWVKTIQPSIQRKESIGIIGAGPCSNNTNRLFSLNTWLNSFYPSIIPCSISDIFFY